jgi:septal ring factor EnvC (AmiA/AmiB activator)
MEARDRWLIVWIVTGVVVLAVTGYFLMSMLGSLKAMDANLAAASKATSAAGTNVKPLSVDLTDVRGTLEKLNAALKPAPGETSQVSASLGQISTSLSSVETSLKTTSDSLNNTSSLLSQSAGSLSHGASTLGSIGGTLDDIVDPLKTLSSTLSNTTNPLSSIDNDLSQTENTLSAVGGFVKKIEAAIKKRVKTGPSKKSLVCKTEFFGGGPGC